MTPTGQVDGPFVWQTTVSWNNLQQWPKKHMCLGTRLCAQCLLRWVLYNPGTRTPIIDRRLTVSLQIPGGRMAELYSGKTFFLIKNIGGAI